MTGIPADRTTYRLERRYRHKRASKPLSAFALDITLRFNKYGTPFLEDHNGGGPMPFNTLDEVVTFVSDEIRRNYADYFASNGA